MVVLTYAGRAESAIRVLSALLQSKDANSSDLTSLRMYVSTLQLLAKVNKVILNRYTYLLK